MASKKPVGAITRGTTNPNRLRRIDRYLCSLPVLKQTAKPVVVDLGFGASPITAVELLERCQKTNPATTVVGIEIDRERVARGEAVAHEQLQFQLGGFETPLPANLVKSLGSDRVTIIRAFNVLRQYDESEVKAAWSLMQSRLADNGLLIEGTCDEIGRLASWITLDRNEPLWFTISVRLSGLDEPSKVAERLPKALIHHNVPGEKIHSYLQALDEAWRTNSPLSSFGANQRWLAVCESMVAAGWPVKYEPKRFKLGEITVAYSAVSAN